MSQAIGEQGGRGQGDEHPRLLRLFGLSRYVMVLAVVSTLAASTSLLVYGTLQTVDLVVQTLGQDGVSLEWAQRLRLEFIEVVDLFLIATVLFVVALGLFQLFVYDVPVPRWLEIESVAELEQKLIGMVITVIAVFFLAVLVSGDQDGQDLQGLGIGVGVVVVALTYFSRQLSRESDHEREDSR